MQKTEDLKSLTQSHAGVPSGSSFVQDQDAVKSEQVLLLESHSSATQQKRGDSGKVKAVLSVSLSGVVSFAKHFLGSSSHSHSSIRDHLLAQGQRSDGRVGLPLPPFSGGTSVHMGDTRSLLGLQPKLDDEQRSSQSALEVVFI